MRKGRRRALKIKPPRFADMPENIPHPPGCPACAGRLPLRWVEDHFDRVGGKPYRLLSCPDCGVVSTEPREPVGARWYVKAAPLRALEKRPPPEADWRFRQFFSEGIPPGRLLDVGCGDGSFLNLARRAGFQTTGFDYDQRVVAQAKALGLADVHAMEFSCFCAGRQAGEFDVATLFDVLEHTPEPAWFLGQVKRLIKPGGHVAVTLPNALRPLPWGREEHDFPPHHFTRWTPGAMRAFLEGHGFSVVRQDAGTLKLRYLSDHFFFFRLMPGLLKIARQLLFGRSGQRPQATLTELYAAEGTAGWLSDKLLRQKIVNAARLAFQILFTPAALGLKVYYRSRQRRCGDCLYTLARRRDNGAAPFRR